MYRLALSTAPHDTVTEDGSDIATTPSGGSGPAAWKQRNDKSQLATLELL